MTSRSVESLASRMVDDASEDGMLSVMQTVPASNRGQGVLLILQRGTGKTTAAFLPYFVMQLLSKGGALLEGMSQTVENMPSYQLSVGRDLATLPLLVRELLEAGEEEIKTSRRHE